MGNPQSSLESSSSESEKVEEFEVIRPIVVTGFGKVYPDDASDESNFSWRVVEKLSSTIIDNKGRVVPVFKGKPSEENKSIPKPVEVRYSYVDGQSFQDWLDSTDALVYIHFGIKESQTNCVYLETTAKRDISFTEDHFDHECRNPDPMEVPLTTSFLDNDYLDTLCAKLSDRFKSGITMKSHSDTPIELSFKVSKDAGNFLCDYLYYESLDLASKRTNMSGTNFPRNVLFIHIPDELCRKDEGPYVCPLDEMCETCESEKADAFVDVIEFIMKDLLTQVNNDDTAMLL